MPRALRARAKLFDEEVKKTFLIVFSQQKLRRRDTRRAFSVVSEKKKVESNKRFFGRVKSRTFLSFK